MTQLPQAQLFLGFPIDSSYAKKLDLISEELKSIFIRNDSQGEYLQQIRWKDQTYLGKYVSPTNLGSLVLLEKNIMTILKKLVSDHPYKTTSLILFSTLSAHDIGS